MWKDYFSFNKRQRNGIIVLLSLIVIMLVWLTVSDHIPPKEGTVDFSLFKAEIDKAKAGAKQTDSVTIEEHLNTDTSVHITSININYCTVKELSKVPNVGYYLAQAIVNYRVQHGNYKEVKDLLKNAAIDEITYSKIERYLTTETEN